MNLTQAEAIASLYAELLESIDQSKIIPPVLGWGTGSFELKHLESISLEDGQVKIHWSKYVGCGDYDTDDTYHSLDQFFQ
jgi:hypothetical protein